MADIQLCAKLFDAMNPAGRIVLIGDYNQLPSVGPGLVLRDLITSGTIPAVMLNQIFRQAGSSRIISNAHSIINHSGAGEILLRLSKEPGGDFYFLPESDPRKILALVQLSVAQMKNTYGFDIGAVQVLSPVHHGDLGVETLNYTLQKQLNKNTLSIETEDKEFFLGDKVSQTRNNYELEVFNGEVGFISEIAYTKDHAVKVTYPDREIWYPITALPELDLAYAQTVHRLQGSEYPVIIMPVHESQGQGLSKNLLYTAITRAKNIVILIGSADALSAGLRRETTIERESNLVGRLQAILPPV